MKCFHHAERDAVALCKQCAIALCAGCVQRDERGATCGAECARRLSALEDSLRRSQASLQSAGPAQLLAVLVLLGAGGGLLAFGLANDFALASGMGGLFLLLGSLAGLGLWVQRRSG